METSDLDNLRQGLLKLFASREIDKATYDQMLADLMAEERRASASIGNLRTLVGPARAVEPSHAQPLTPGMELGGFRLEGRIGRGGMGEVWRAYDPIADRRVVIKVVPPDVQRNEGEMVRVRDTFRRIHALHHQHICPVHVLGDDPSCGYFIVMQFIEGKPLSAYCRQHTAEHGSFPVTEAVRVLAPVAAALDYAHGQKVVHRDIKPDNILVVDGGRDVQVIDFGLAAEIHTSMSRVSQVQMDISGTRPYMAPEQWRGQYQDARTDQYSLGVVAYELLSGRLPFDVPDTAMMRLCVLQDPPPPLEGQPAPVNEALAKALAKDREGRFGNCREFVEALEWRSYLGCQGQCVGPGGGGARKVPGTVAADAKRSGCSPAERADPRHGCAHA